MQRPDIIIKSLHLLIMVTDLFVATMITHIYEIAEKSVKQYFEGSMTISEVTTFWELLTKCHTITLITTDADKLP
jgi:hypothetical protein